MLGAIASFVGFGVGGHIASESLKKFGRGAVSTAFKSFNALRSSGAGIRAVIEHAGRTRAVSGLRKVYSDSRSYAFKELTAKSHEIQDNFRERLVKGYNRRINLLARKVGGTKAFNRKIVRDAIRGEVKFLPITYAMYKHEQHTGQVDPSMGFGKYYLTQGLPMSLAFSAGLDASRRSFKVAGMRAFKNNRAAAFGIEAMVKLGAESLHNLNNVTKGMASVYDNSISKLMSANQSFGAFRGTNAAIREMTAVANATNANRARRMDFYRYKANAGDHDIKLEESLTHSYKEAMGDLRHGRETQGMKRLMSDQDVFSYSRSELKREGINLKANKAHRGLRELAGMKSYGDDIGYTTSKRATRTTVFREGKDYLGSREVTQYLTKDRARMDILGGEYDFGNFHIDAIRDSLNKIATQTLNVANRPWLNFLDGGNNWLMSKKSKMLQFGLKKGAGVVGAGFKSTTRVSIAHASDMDSHTIDEMVKNEDYEGAAVYGIQRTFNTTEERARAYLGEKQRRAMDALAKGSPGEEHSDLLKTVTADIALRFKHGEIEFGSGDVLNIVGGHAQIHTNVEGLGYTTFTLHHNGEAIRGASLLRGDTRAGQLAGSILGGRQEISTFHGNKINVGVESSETIAHTEYYNDQSLKAKILTHLEWAGGQEQSLWGKLISPFTKWNDPTYIGKHVSDVKRGVETVETLRHKFTKNTLNSTETIQMGKAVNNYAEHNIRKLYGYMKASAEGNASINKEADFPAMFSRVQNAILDSNTVSPAYGSFLRDFNPETMIIGANDSPLVIQRKLGHLRSLHEKHFNTANKIGFDTNAVDELDEILNNSGSGLRHSALGGTLKNGIDAADKVNRNVFEALISVAHEGDHVDPNVGHVLSTLAMEGKELAARGGMRDGQITEAGIVNLLKLRKHSQTFKEKVPELDERGARQFAESIVELSDHWGDFSLMDSIGTHGGKKRLRQAASAENHFILLSENSWSNHLGLSTEGPNLRSLPIGRAEVEQLAAVNTMNSALSLLGLGFNIGNKTVTVGDIVQKTLVKRVLPFAGIMAAHDLITGTIQNTPGLQNTSLAGGLTGVAWDAYAGARVLSQTVSDFTGITQIAKYAEDLMPGSIDSPLSGLVRGVLPIAMGLKMGSVSRLGATRGGLIGTAVGMLLGGGPLGIFGDWNIAKGREEVIQELSGEKEVEVRKGRFWELSAGSFMGNKTTYFRPHMYALQKMQYERGSNYIGNDPLETLGTYLDPGALARKHYLSRPYPVVGGMGSNVPIIGSLLGAVSGQQYMHEDMLQEMGNSALLSGSTAGLPAPTEVTSAPIMPMRPGIPTPFNNNNTGFYGGGIVGGPSRSLMPPDDPNSFATVVDESAGNLLDVAGLRGFMVGSVMEGITGSKTGFGGGVRLESANDIASASKMYWEKELGGVVGLSEGIRRILPNPSTGGVESWNELPNVQANFLPGAGSFTDFLVGDAEGKLQYGEARLPGGSYELTKNIFYTYPIDASMMRRPYEEQVGFYAGDVMTLSTMRRRWHVVERTRKDFIAQMKKSTEIIKERDIAYDPDNDVHAYVDAISRDPTGEKTAILVAPVERGYMDPAGEAQLNAFLVNNTKEIHNGLLIGLDKDGNTTQQIIHADMKRYMDDVKAAQQAAQAGSRMTKDLEESGASTNRWPAYSHLNRLEILLNVAPFSPEAQLEMKVVQKQKEVGQFGKKQKDKYYQLMDQFVKRLNSLDTDEYRFLPLVMGKTPIGTAAIKRMQETQEKYSLPEQYVGSVWEYVSHLRNPISNKLLGNRSMLEAYKQDVAIGKSFKQWTSPVEDFVMNPLEVVASEEDSLQAAISGATGGFIFGGPVGMGIGAVAAGMSSFLGISKSERSGRWQDLDRINAMSDALKYKELEQLDAEQEGSERRFNLRRKGSIYYNYTQGTQEGPAGVNDVVASVSPAERSYVRRVMQNLYKEDVEGLGNLMPEYSRGLLNSYANQQTVDTTAYSSYLSDARRIIQGAPLKFRSDDMVYKTLQNQGYQATDLSLGWKQQINRVRYIESQGNEIPDMMGDPGYPGIVPGFSALRR